MGCVGGMGPSAAVSPVTSFQTANRRVIFGAMVDWRALRSDRDEFVDSVLEPDRGVGTDPAGEDDDRYVVVACELRGTDRSLASDGLGVDAAFSREHPISARDGVL